MRVQHLEFPLQLYRIEHGTIYSYKPQFPRYRSHMHEITESTTSTFPVNAVEILFNNLLYIYTFFKTNKQ